MAAKLPLRDVHLPAAPSWWPLPPGWWMVIGAVLVVTVVVAGLLWLRRRRRRRWLALFDGQVAAALEGPVRLAAISDLLRRAARRADARAAQLQGEAWLRFLDGRQGREFSDGEGRLLLEGAYRPQVDVQGVEQVRALARTRFLELMEGKR